MKEILVLKFGGSVLENDKTIRNVARMVRDVSDRGFSPVVVVSALKGDTEKLLQISKNVNPNASLEIMDEILSMGERTSARIITAALSAEGLDSITIDPDSNMWPIITNDVYMDASPLNGPTKDGVENKLRPLIDDGKIPVVCGYVGKSQSGKITTMGRGGSDTTAVVLGNHLNAKEVILVKDVASVFSSDPDKVSNPVAIHQMNSDEAFDLASGGAKLIHSKSLQYKSDKVRIRVSSLSKNNLSGTVIDDGPLESGTVIDGGPLEMKAQILSRKVSKITLIGIKWTDNDVLAKLINTINEYSGTLLSLSLDSKTVTLYTDGGDNMTEKIHSLLIDGGMAKAISSFDDLAMMNISGSGIETMPGLIQKVTRPISSAGINIYGMATIGSSIRIFVRNDDSATVVDMMGNALMIDSTSRTDVKGDN